MAVGRGDAAAVADHQVAAVASNDRVVVATADHDVSRRTGRDGVSAAAQRRVRRTEQRGRCALDQVDVRSVRVCARRRGDRALGAHVVDPAVVAEHDVLQIAAACGFAEVRNDRVAVVAAEDDVLADASGDRVDAAVVEFDRLDQSQRDRQGPEARQVRVRCGDAATVADHQVAAVAGGDGVFEATADDDVIAIAGGDGVGTTVDRGGGAFNQVNVAQVAIGQHVVDETEVAQDDVVSGPGIDQVARIAAQQQVVVLVACDGVGRAVGRLGRGHADHGAGVQQAQGAGSLVDHSVVAEHDVVAPAALQRVAAGHQRIAGQHRAGVAGGYGQQACHHCGVRSVLGHIEGEVEARVAVDMVIATVAEDLVVTRAAGQVVCRLAAAHRVVACTAVDRHPPADRAGVDDIVAGVGVVARVAGEDVQVGT